MVIVGRGDYKKMFITLMSRKGTFSGAARISIRIHATTFVYILWYLTSTCLTYCWPCLNGGCRQLHLETYSQYVYELKSNYVVLNIIVRCPYVN